MLDIIIKKARLKARLNLIKLTKLYVINFSKYWEMKRESRVANKYSVLYYILINDDIIYWSSVLNSRDNPVKYC